jgi:hypothetical protein
MANFKFITDVSNLDLLQGLAQTRRRLVLSTVGGLAATYGAGFAASWYINEVSGSVIWNMFVITGVMFLVLIASYLLTLLIGDLSFKGPWRETVVLDNLDGRDDAPVASHSGEFLVILVLAIVGNGVGLNVVTGGFLDQYHTVGYFKVRLRADSPEARVNGLHDLTKPTNRPNWSRPDVQAVVTDAFDDPTPEVRSMAVWAAGEMNIQSATDRLIEVMKEDPAAEVRGRAAIALGKLGLYPKTRKAIESVLKEAEAPEAIVGALRGLGLMASADSVSAILPVIDSDHEDVMLSAFWALRQIGSERARDAVRAVIDSDPSHLRKCAAWDTFKMVASDKDILWARRMYQKDDLGPPCEMRVWEEPHNTSHRILVGDTFHEKLIKIIANEAGVEYRDWFQRIVNDPSAPGRLREVASEVIGQIRSVESE